MPVLKSGAVSVHPVGTPTVPVAGILIDIDFDAPDVKLIPTGAIIQIGVTPDGPLYLEAFIIDPNFPAFANCANLRIQVTDGQRVGNPGVPHTFLDAPARLVFVLSSLTTSADSEHLAAAAVHDPPWRELWVPTAARLEAMTAAGELACFSARSTREPTLDGLSGRNPRC